MGESSGLAPANRSGRRNVPSPVQAPHRSAGGFARGRDPLRREHVLPARTGHYFVGPMRLRGVQVFPRANCDCVYQMQQKALDARLRGHDGKGSIGSVIPAKAGIQFLANPFATRFRLFHSALGA